MEKLIYTQTAKAITYTDMPDKCKQLYQKILEQSEIEKKFDTAPWSYKDYAEYLRCTVKTISRHVKRLTALGIISVQRANGFVTEYFVRDLIGSNLQKASTHKELFKPVTVKPKTKTYETQLDPSQIQLRAYIINKLKISISDKKLLILLDTADNNENIENKERYRIIMKCANKTAAYRPVNPFGYLKKLIRTYTDAPEHEEAVPEQKTETLEYEGIANSLSYKLKDDYDQRYHLSVKQCNALISIAVKRCGIPVERAFNFILHNIINQIRNCDIKDMFAYVRVMMHGFQQCC